MADLFRLEVDTGSGGYGFTDTLEELLTDVEREYGEETRNEVEKWALNSKENDQFHKYGMYITKEVFRFGEPGFERAITALSWFHICSIVVTVSALIVCVIINAIK